MKYHIYVGKFQNRKPNFTSFIKEIRDTEDLIAIKKKKKKKGGKLSIHFKKCRFDF